ncbi:MAG: phytanoyl-CoA dioxygenase family protein [Proteobacteria bacterium]|nr:phytanoyl-CoA dioxygenase family protein [Pseudomonadota bacterium]
MATPAQQVKPDDSLIDSETAEFLCNGYVIVKDVLSSDQIELIRRALHPYLQGEHFGRNDFEGFATERVYALLAKSVEFSLIIDHPRISPIIDRLVNPSYLLWAALAINLHPGETMQNLHRDNIGQRPPGEGLINGVSTMWAIDDFTSANGATRLLPRSQTWEQGRMASERDRADLIAAQMPAGSVLIWSSEILHAGGANTSDRSRLGITVQYCQPWLRQLESFLLVLPPEIARTLPERVQELVGYSIFEPGIMGYADGMHPKRFLRDDYQGRKAQGKPS